MARLPQPPITMLPHDLHRSLSDMINFIRQTYDNGSQHTSFTQAEIDTFTDKSYIATILGNSTTGQSNISKRDPSDAEKVVWVPIT